MGAEPSDATFQPAAHSDALPDFRESGETCALAGSSLGRGTLRRRPVPESCDG